MRNLVRHHRSSVTVERVESPAARALALRVVEEVYLGEKRWIRDADAEIPADLTERPDHSWFVATVDGEPAGAIRLVYDPSLEMPAEYGVTLEPGLDVEGLKRRGRFADVGRFMIVPRHRRGVAVALALMKAVTTEVVARGYTHLLTDVFESDLHSPLKFHTRVLGFERIGTHRTGELSCSSLRILLVLDIGRAYERLKPRRNKVWKALGEDLRTSIEGRLVPSSA